MQSYLNIKIVLSGLEMALNEMIQLLYVIDILGCKINEIVGELGI